jgi:hypothetical protein
MLLDFLCPDSTTLEDHLDHSHAGSIDMTARTHTICGRLSRLWHVEPARASLLPPHTVRYSLGAMARATGRVRSTIFLRCRDMPPADVR